MAYKPNPYPLRVDERIMAKFKVIAKENGRSVNKELEMAMKSLIRSYERENGPIVINLPEEDQSNN